MLMAVAVVLGACGDDSSTSTTSPSTSAAAPSTSAEATVENTTSTSAPAELAAVDQELTEWLATGAYDWIVGSVAAVDLPEEIADHFLAALTDQAEAGESVTVVLVTDSEPAVITIERRGLADDSVAGVDLRVTAESDDEAGWAITNVEERSLCARGLSGDGLCL